MVLCDKCRSSSKNLACHICGHRCAEAPRVRTLNPEFVRDGGYDSNIVWVCRVCVREVLFLNLSRENKQKWRGREIAMSE